MAEPLRRDPVDYRDVQGETPNDAEPRIEHKSRNWGAWMIVAVFIFMALLVWWLGWGRL